MARNHGQRRSFSVSKDLSYFSSRQCLAIVPGHPFSRTFCQFPCMPLQLGQVIEAVGSAKLAGMNQTHKQIPDLSTVQCPVEQCVLPMKHDAFQRSFDDIMPPPGLCCVLCPS